MGTAPVMLPLPVQSSSRSSGTTGLIVYKALVSLYTMKGAEAAAIDKEAVQFPPKPLKRMKMKRDPKKLRMGGGKVWEDHSLDDWDQGKFSNEDLNFIWCNKLLFTDDFRIFVGDLGNDVNDDTLARSFSKYSSFLKARVIRDKYTKKTKGYGFVSFKNPQDFMQAMKEMNGMLCNNGLE